jgi:hypothetical protein
MATRYQRSNQNPYIEEEHTTQWLQETKGAIRIYIEEENKTQWQQNTKGTIRITI